MDVGQYVIPFNRLRHSDVQRVGGKNASLGEMISQLSANGIRVPDGFATTAEAFHEFLRDNGLTERIAKRLQHLNVEDLGALEAAGRQIRLNRKYVIYINRL
jgi:pyruvate,water dikinase